MHQHSEASTPVEMVLERLEKVRKNGSRGWVARCPSHQDRMASLSVCEGGGGRVLINCFAGCSALDVVQSLGMTIAELFPQPIKEDMTREEQIELHERAMRTKWSAALATIDNEAFVLHMVAQKIASGGTIDKKIAKRVASAASKIANARVVLSTGPSKKRLDTYRKPGEKK